MGSESAGRREAVLPPVAGFTAAPLSGESPLTVIFTHTTTGKVSGYLWTFGTPLPVMVPRAHCQAG